MAKRVLLTGSGGFIGAHCLEYFLDHTDWELICLDSFRHKGTISRTKQVEIRAAQKAELKGRSDWDRVKTYVHDLTVPIDIQLENLILDRRIVNGRVVEKKLDIIINMASDSAVERSTQDPVACMRNNYELAINMLEFARKVKPNIFFQISTDEVYGEAGDGDGHLEWARILPSNPYAASKAAQEAIAMAYWRTFDVPVVLTNTQNNIGEWQDPEKFLPRIVQQISIDKNISIYADSPDKIGKRFYMHAKNHASALVFLSRIKPAMYAAGDALPDRWNVCGDTELDNLQMAQLVADIMGKPLKYELVASESARKGYDRRYALDGSKLTNAGWVPPVAFRESVEQIVHWTVAHPEWAI